MIPVINKPTRITRKNATAIDHIITNSFLDKCFETGIIKTDISDHFPIFLLTGEEPNSHSNKTIIFKRKINDRSTV